MKRIAVLATLLILVAVALLLMRRSPSHSRASEGVSPPKGGFGGKTEIEHAKGEVPENAHVLDSAPSLAQKDVVAPIAVGSQTEIDHSRAKGKVPMNRPEHDATGSVVDEEGLRFVRIAFDRAKEVMKITDTSTATVEYRDNIAIVTFPFPRPKTGDRPPYPGPDYLARVKINRKTGEVLEILGAQ